MGGWARDLQVSDLCIQPFLLYANSTLAAHYLREVLAYISTEGLGDQMPSTQPWVGAGKSSVLGEDCPLWFL